MLRCTTYSCHVEDEYVLSKTGRRMKQTMFLTQADHEPRLN